MNRRFLNSRMLFYRSTDVLQNSTFPCEDMRSYYYGCDVILAVWTPGNKGTCVTKQYGYQIGPNGIQFAMLQVNDTIFYE